MRKIIASINVTVDGFCDHTAVIADEEFHHYINNLLSNADTVLLGRVTYQLFETYWPLVAKNGTGTVREIEFAHIEFAHIINNITKIVFSKTLKTANPIAVGWKNTKLIKENIAHEMHKIKQQPGQYIITLGSPGIVSAFMQLNLIDECRFFVQPILLGNGKQLFEEINRTINLKLLDTRTFNSGVVELHYQAKNN